MIEEQAVAPGGDEVSIRVPAVLRRADLALLAVKERPLRAVGVSGSNYAVLANLQVTPGLTGAELARVVGVTPQAVAPLVGKLADRGLIERRAHPRHASVQELHLTDSGRRELARADKIMVDLDHHLRRSLGEENYDRLHELLERLIEHMPGWVPPQ